MAQSRTRGRPPRSRLVRFFNVGIMLARIYGGYKLLGLRERVEVALERRFSLLRPVGANATAAERARARLKRHHAWSAQRLHDTAVKNQGLLIKTAQFLSSRPDVVPDEYIDVLSSLQDEVPPEPFDVIRRAIEHELGQPLDSVYREFERQPIASASLAQVHRAVLKDGRVAAVKVQYPGIERIVAIDLKNIERFINILNRLDKTLDYHFIAEEMGRMIPQELDFIHEGHNAEAIAANFAGVEDIVVPAIYWEHSSARVLTMEYVEGVKITDLDGMRRLGIDSVEVAKVLIVAFSEMLLEHGLFHADPHPGNLLVAPGPKLILVDFGQVKEVGPQFRFVFAQMTRALLAEDNTALGQSFRDLGFRMEKDTDSGYEALGKAYVGDIAKEMTATQAGWADPAMFEDSYRDVVRILRANHLIKIPPDLLFVGRVMGLLNGLSMVLQSRTNLLVEMARLLDKGNGASPGDKSRKSRRLLEA
jgi:predicted unusual protein kinase regulating ubiquinone biosynthesis (AarF/ABC1/UbiB family)